MSHKIGVGVITCNRQNFFEQCINSIPNVDTIVVVNDGSPYPSTSYPGHVKEVIQHIKNKSVGVSKNEAMRFLIQQGCDSLFIIEDDMLIKNPEVFTTYIKAAEKSGIWHLNFGYHGPMNKTQDGKPNPRNIIDYGDGIEVAFNPNCVGSFSYYHKGIIKNIGYINERFINAFDHVEHTYRIIKAGLHSPFWWFADVAKSYDYIGELDIGLQNSAIRKNTEEFAKRVQQGMLTFRQMYGMTPVQIPDTSPDQVLNTLDTIQKTYARKIL